MAQTSLDSFDPFAIHPFTNSSGLVPQPPRPSQYSTTLSSPSSRPSKQQTLNSSVTNAAMSGQPRAPQPRYAGTAPRPIFEPYRRESSTPDLVLKKKSPSAKR